MEFEKLKEIIADVLNVEADDITEDTKFVDDLGADSLDIFQIIMGIEETLRYCKLIMMRLKRSQQSEMRLSRSKKQQITRMLGVKSPAGFFILWGINYESGTEMFRRKNRIYIP